VKGLDQRTPQVSIQAKIIFVDRTDVEELGVNTISARRRSSSTSSSSGPTQRFRPAGVHHGVRRAQRPRADEELLADREYRLPGRQTRCRRRQRESGGYHPALDLIFSTAIGNFDLTAFVQALQTRRARRHSGRADDQHARQTGRRRILVGDRVPIRVIDVSSVSTGGGTGTAVPRATVSFQQTGINLRVTPHVTANRQILMEVHAERSSIKPAAVDIGFTFQTQQADNQILVNGRGNGRSWRTYGDRGHGNEVRKFRSL